MSFADFQKNPNQFSWQEIRLLLLIGVGVVVVLGLLIYGNIFLSGILPEGGEFWLLRESGRAFLFDRIEPYSANVPARVQEQVYGRVNLAGEEPYILDVPFHLLLVFFPVALFPDPASARIFWLTVLEIGLLVFVFLSYRLTDWQRPGILVALFFLFCLPMYYAYLALGEGASVILLALVYAGILASLRRNTDELAGALMVLASFQWEVGGLFLFFLSIQVLRERRWRVLAGYGMFFLILFAISLIWYPGWVLPFLRAVVNNLRADFGFAAREIFANLWPSYGSQLGLAILVILVLSMGFEWTAVQTMSSRRFYWVATLMLTIPPLLGFRTEAENLVVLVLPLSLVFAVTHQRWKKAGAFLSLLLILSVSIIPWILFYYALPVYGKLVEEILFLFLPVFTVIALYWVRWWAIRPPRTWLESAKQT